MAKKIVCPSCGCELKPRWNEENTKCPICFKIVNVKHEREAQEVVKENAINVIKYGGDESVFVWRHPVRDFAYGTQLIVHESQEAIFFKDGQALDLFGAGRYTLENGKLPFLERVFHLPTNQSVFSAEVYFVNLATHMGVKWGTDSKIRLFDPSSGMHIEIGASGSFNIRVTESRKFILKIVGTSSGFTDIDFIGNGSSTSLHMLGKFRALIMNSVKANIARIIKEESINILEIDAYIDIISEKLKIVINDVLDDYGLYMPEFYVSTIVTPDDDLNFAKLKQQYAQKTLKVRDEEILKAEAEAARERKIVEAQTVAELKKVSAEGEAEAIRLKAQAEAEAYRMKAFAEAEEMKMKGYTYQQETARQVGMEAMQHGLTGNGNGGSMLGTLSEGMGELASLGIGLGAMSSMVSMTKEAMAPVMNSTATMGANMMNVGNAGLVWNCSCGTNSIQSNFCPNCGAKRIEYRTNANWNCSCGMVDINSNFCPNCGCKRGE